MASNTSLSSVVSLVELANDAFVTPGFGPGDRTDPFWSMVWPNSDGGPAISWRSIHSDRAMDDAGVRAPIRTRGQHGNPRARDEAIALLHRRRSRIVTLSAVNLWRTITGEQLAAMTGQIGLNSSRSDEIKLLFEAGLIHRGRFHYPGRPLDGAPEMFRPDAQSDKVDLRSLRYADWLSVTLGGPLLKGHQYDRHNILTTELSLRAGEICPLRSVLGEAVATWPRLFGSKLQPNPHRSADAVWVREDGLKIAVEMTATVTPATIKKIEQLADLLARDTMKSAVILFVVAAHPNQGLTNDVAGRLRQAVKKSAHSSMNRVLADVENRMVIAKWEDFFPAPGLASREFVRLRAQRYSASDDDWIFTDLLDPFDVPFLGARSHAVEETSTNLNDVLGAPWWMRTGPGANLNAYLLEKAHFPSV